jgi:hypothetical protein
VEDWKAGFLSTHVHGLEDVQSLSNAEKSNCWESSSSSIGSSGGHSVIDHINHCILNEQPSQAAVRMALSYNQNASPLKVLMESRGVQVVDFEGWRKIDAVEVDRGLSSKRVRCKVVDVEEMIRIAAAHS